jgi:hypothetical protein
VRFSASIDGVDHSNQYLSLVQAVSPDETPPFAADTSDAVIINPAATWGQIISTLKSFA